MVLRSTISAVADYVPGDVENVLAAASAYLPDELDHIPYGMDNVLWENRGREKLSAALLAQQEGQPAEAKGDEDS